MVNLFDYNEKVYRSAIDMLTLKNKSAIVHPTGTVKSFTAFKSCDDNSNKTTCWLSISE